jgi:tetratricopeptide (TPR) repeat protein
MRAELKSSTAFRKLQVRRFLLSAAALLAGAAGGFGQTKSGAGFGAEPEKSTAPAALMPVPSPDLAGMDAAVQQQVREAQSRVAASGSGSREMGEAYGRLGEIYQTYGLLDAAKASYANAHALEPDEFRWPYYLGYVYQSDGDLNLSATNYELARQLKPADEMVTLRLADAYLGLNSLDEAESLYSEQLGRDKKSVAALDGLGRVALARREFAKAVAYLNQALALDPQAAYIHYPLAMAYRGLGEREKAAIELRKHGPAAPELVDPYLTALQDIKTGRGEMWEKASHQMAANDLPGAIATYRKLVETNEQDATAKTYLGTALARAGDREDAIKQFNEALRIAPKNPETHYCLGVVLAAAGRDVEAIGHFRSTIQGDPDFGEVHFQLANVLMRAHHYAEASGEYSKAVAQDPKNSFAAVMESLALVRLKRYRDACEVLEQAHKIAPGDPDVVNALARLLAAAPDEKVRDGKRALDLMQEVVKTQGGADSDQAETIAMALAETGQYQKAVNVERSVIQSVEQGDSHESLNGLKARLALYERGQACRIPWRDEDPIFVPTPQTNGDARGQPTSELFRHELGAGIFVVAIGEQAATPC